MNLPNLLYGILQFKPIIFFHKKTGILWIGVSGIKKTATANGIVFDAIADEPKT